MNKRTLQKEKIIDAAKRVFARYGFRKTTLSDVAQELGVTTAAIYYYFDSKEELFLETIKTGVDRIAKLISEAISKEEKPIEKIKAFIFAKIQGIKEITNVFSVSDEIASEVRGEVEKVRQKEFYKMEIASIKNIIKEGMEKGHLRNDVDPMKIAFIIYAISKEFETKLDVKREEIDEIINIVAEGFLKR